MTNKPKFAPGCFGQPYGYANDPVCRKCPYSAECAPAHDAAVNALRRVYGLAEIPKRKSEVMSAKAKMLFEQLGVSEDEVAAAMSEGRSPYPATNPMGTICNALLIAQRAGVSLDRKAICEILKKRRGLADNTAMLYARHAVQILTHCGVASERSDGSISIVAAGGK